MTTDSEDEVECMEKIEELHQILNRLKEQKKAGQTEKIDEKIGNVEKALARYVQFTEK